MVTAERERQIRENLGLVHTVANRFRGRGIEYDDLYQSGCVGLIKAVDRFDPTLGYAFSTYAVPVKKKQDASPQRPSCHKVPTATIRFLPQRSKP